MLNREKPCPRLTDGNFYGTASDGDSGGDYGNGTVFEITPSGTLTTLYNFCSVVENGVCTDGNNPAAGLVQATNGNVYGTTYYGGSVEDRKRLRVGAKAPPPSHPMRDRLQPV